MDSGSSASFQSSSTGGEEEYDSRAAKSLSAFFNSTNPRSHGGPMTNPPQQQQQPLAPQPPPPLSSSSSSMFDPSLTNYFDPSFARTPPLNPNTNPLLNLDLLLPKTLRSDQNDGNFNLQSLHGTVASSSQAFGGSLSNSLQVQETVSPSSRASASASNDNNNNNNNNNVGRNPKKRSRASRRAPTTVLTTDTTNFRAMVQEFTGIPAPPFAAPPPFQRRLDLFGSPSTSRRSGPGFLEASPPPYLLRPFAQKVQPPSLFVSSSSSLFPSSMVDAIVSTTSTNNTSNPSSSFGYQIPSDLALLKQQQSENILGMNMQNPVFSFQPLLQTPPRYPLSNSAILASKQTQTTSSLGIPSSTAHDDPSELRMGLFENNHLGSSHGQADINTNLGGLHNIDQWRHGDQGLLMSINGGYGSTSDFHGDKGAENVATRSEGMVESWICSTD